MAILNSISDRNGRKGLVQETALHSSRTLALTQPACGEMLASDPPLQDTTTGRGISQRFSVVRVSPVWSAEMRQTWWTSQGGTSGEVMRSLGRGWCSSLLRAPASCLTTWSFQTWPCPVICHDGMLTEGRTHGAAWYLTFSPQNCELNKALFKRSACYSNRKQTNTQYTVSCCFSFTFSDLLGSIFTAGKTSPWLLYNWYVKWNQTSECEPHAYFLSEKVYWPGELFYSPVFMDRMNLRMC